MGSAQSRNTPLANMKHYKGKVSHSSLYTRRQDYSSVSYISHDSDSDSECYSVTKSRSSALHNGIIISEHNRNTSHTNATQLWITTGVQLFEKHSSSPMMKDHTAPSQPSHMRIQALYQELLALRWRKMVCDCKAEIDTCALEHTASHIQRAQALQTGINELEAALGYSLEAEARIQRAQEYEMSVGDGDSDESWDVVYKDSDTNKASHVDTNNGGCDKAKRDATCAVSAASETDSDMSLSHISCDSGCSSDASCASASSVSLSLDTFGLYSDSESFVSHEEYATLESNASQSCDLGISSVITNNSRTSDTQIMESYEGRGALPGVGTTNDINADADVQIDENDSSDGGGDCINSKFFVVPLARTIVRFRSFIRSIHAPRPPLRRLRALARRLSGNMKHGL